MNTAARQNFRLQQWICLLGVVLFIIKLLAWYLTKSVAILTDALESTVNVVSAFVGLYSLYLSARPKDQNHPYGHGKIEFVSAGVEGTLILLAGLLIIYEAVDNFTHPHTLQQLDYGIVLVAVAALVNYALGYVAIQQGKKYQSLALVASGKHLQADTYTTVGIIIGLILLYFTSYKWIDSVVAVIFALLIVYNGLSILRSVIAGVMDEADEDLLVEIIAFLHENRRVAWVDIHNFRIIKYGMLLHVDCHLTVPWYFTVQQGHDETAALERLIKQKYDDDVELFVHLDGCVPTSCQLCTVAQCPHRQHDFVQKITWTRENISYNQKHQLSDNHHN
jgi:cation diffusion facilitator family transporter